MNRCLTIDEEIIINQFSQGIHSLDDMNIWFDSYDYLNKKDIMENLLTMVIQSHPTIDDIEHVAIILGKKNTSSAAILMSRNKPFSKFGYRVCGLPEKELLNGFDILLLTLSIADNRRKETEDASKCNHWWHNDLSDENYLKELKKLKSRR